MSAILSTEQISHSFGDRWLFKTLSFGIQRGDRVALVGVNGTGKSTLLKILSGLFLPNEGKVVLEKGLKIGYLAQDPNFKNLTTIEDFLFTADNYKQQLVKQYDALMLQEDFDHDLFQRLSDEMTAADAWSYEESIKTIINRLGLTDLKQEIKSLSGGQKKRLSLAKLLVDEPDVYILDEPTNHLDIETIEWLEKILTTGNKTVLLVTHDRYFLDNICTEIKEMDQGSFYSYKGNYLYFLEKKAEREEMDGRTLEKNKNLLRKELEWMRRQPKARGTKSKSRIDAFHTLKEKTQVTGGNSSVSLDVKISRQGNKILELNNVGKSFGKHLLFNGFSYVFKKGDRIGLAGKNGTGKSTLLNLITQKETPDEGLVDAGDTTVFGYYKQEGLALSENDRVIDVVKNIAEYITLSKGETITASQLLTLFLFPPEKQFGFVNKLSGGEKKRLQLMRVLMLNPNFLILDEPTNDLDIDTLNVLERFLVSFPGVLILVSHDRYLIDKLTDQLFLMEGNGSIKIYNGNYSDYKIEQEATIKASKKDAPTPVSKKETKEAPEQKKLSFKEKMELEKIQEEIKELEENIRTKTESSLSTADYTKIAVLAEEIEILKEKLEEKTLRWLELEEFSV